MVNVRRAILYISASLGPMGGSAILSLVPTLRGEFGVSAGTVALSVTLFMLPFAVLQLFSGPLSDLSDRRKVMIAGLLTYAAGCVVSALSPNINVFLASRVVQGLGYAWISPVTVALIGDITSREDRGMAMGWMGTSVTAGIAAGPFFGGMLADSWRLVFVVFFILTLAFAGAFWVAFRDYHTEARGGKMTEIVPLLRQGVADRNVLLLSFSGFLIFFAYMGSMAFISDSLSRPPLSLDESRIGIIIAISGISGIVASPLAGTSVDRLGRKRTAIMGVMMILLTFLLLRWAGTFWEFGAMFVLIGAGSAFSWAPLNTMSVEVIPAIRGTVVSIFSSIRFTGYALGPVVLAMVYDVKGIEWVYIAGMITMALCIVTLAAIDRIDPAPDG